MAEYVQTRTSLKELAMLLASEAQNPKKLLFQALALLPLWPHWAQDAMTHCHSPDALQHWAKQMLKAGVVATLGMPGLCFFGGDFGLLHSIAAGAVSYLFVGIIYLVGETLIDWPVETSSPPPKRKVKGRPMVGALSACE
jgi:hypothetical protein